MRVCRRIRLSECCVRRRRFKRMKRDSYKFTAAGAGAGAGASAAAPRPSVTPRSPLWYIVVMIVSARAGHSSTIFPSLSTQLELFTAETSSSRNLLSPSLLPGQLFLREAPKRRTSNFRRSKKIHPRTHSAILDSGEADHVTLPRVSSSGRGLYRGRGLGRECSPVAQTELSRIRVFTCTSNLLEQFFDFLPSLFAIYF